MAKVARDNPEAIYHMFEKHWPGTIPGSPNAEVSPSEARKIADKFNVCIHNCAFRG